MLSDNALEILKQLVYHQKVQVGRGYPYPALKQNAQKWINEDPSNALEELKSNDCLKLCQDGNFALTQAGYDVACEGKTVKGTKERIVMHINENGAGEPRSLNRGRLENFRDNLSGCRAIHFDEALKELLREEIIEVDSLGKVTLTGKILKE